jgi:hypothetical protein
VPSRVLCMTADALGTAKGCSWLASGSPVALLGDIRSYEARCFVFLFFFRCQSFI